MDARVDQHLSRLRLVCAAILGSIPIYVAIGSLVARPERPPLAQGEHFLWIFATIAVLNLVSIMPVYRAMLVSPRRVYAAGRLAEPLLAAHFTAHLVAFARLEAVAVLGVALFFLDGNQQSLWIFCAVAGAGMLILWPRKAKVEALLEPTSAAIAP
ncbi:MAG: hypothetical protein ACOY3Y_16635 [Acidobacteriota bacterium]